MEQLQTMETVGAALTAIEALTEPERRSALLLAVLHLRRREGMSDTEMRAWATNWRG